jgi:hypothetical protein
MTSSYRRLEVQLPQFFLEAQRQAEACVVEVLRKEKQTAAKQAAHHTKEADAAKMLREMRERGPSDLSATVPGLALFLEQYWSDIPRDDERVQAVRQPRTIAPAAATRECASPPLTLIIVRSADTGAAQRAGAP